MHVDGRIRAWLTGRGSDPSVRLRYWTEVEPRPASDRRRNARRALGHGDLAEAILADQFPDGHWVTTGSSGEELYRPKYVATNWRAIVLADLGLARDDPRIRRAAEIILRRWSGRGGDLSGQSGEICVTGNAVRTLLRFGYRDHPVVQRSIAWILRTQKRDGGWHCFPSRTGTLDGWEGLAALAEIPLEQRTAGVQQAIGRGASSTSGGSL